MGDSFFVRSSQIVFAPNFVIVSIKHCHDMVEIISVGKLSEEMMSNLEPLTKLQVLYLKKLPNLKSVYWKPWPFPDVCRIFVFKCPELKKLPLEFERADQGKILIINGRIKQLRMHCSHFSNQLTSD